MVETAKGDVEVLELTRAQQAAVRRVAEGRATVPAFTLGLDAAVPALPELVAAVARALRAHPAVNGAYRDGRLERYGRVNVAVLVPGPDGSPLAPVVHDADHRDAARVGQELDALRDRAAAGELTAPEQAGATFTVLTAAVTRVEPVLLPGFAAALGAGTGSLTLACDARALTHEQAAAFLLEAAS